MIIPLNWLKDYVDIKKSPEEIAKSFTSLGLMLNRPIENNIMDLEHRLDRSDWLSIIGCARDLAAMEELELKIPEGSSPESNGKGGIDIKVTAKDLVKRFNTRVFKNIEVKESPDWLKERLEDYGIPAINNIVDITNYVMVEYGQPTHAQDLAKFSKPEIVLRKAKDGEKVITLLGEEVEVDEETLVLSEGDNLIAIGGIVGGNKTGVTETTKDIILDAGNYDQANIRRTSRKINIRNETVLRTEKFLHPELTQTAIERATKLILDLAGGEYYENEDYYPNKEEFTKLELRMSRVLKVGGIELEKEKVKSIILALGYKILEEKEESFELEVPYFRTDVLVEDDIVSDVLRVNNYNNIPMEQLDKAPPKEVTPALYKFENLCRDELVKLGLHEHITNSLVKSDPDNKTQIVLKNSLNADQDALRTSIYETLAPVVSVYNKHKIDEVGIFEVGKMYHKTGNGYEDMKEINILEVIYKNRKLNVKENNRELKSILAAFLQNIGIENVLYEMKDDKAVIHSNGIEVGELRLDSFMFYTENLLKAEKKVLRVRDEIPHTTTEDVTFETKGDVGPTMAKIKEMDELVSKVEYVGDYMKDDKKSVTLRVTIESPNAIDSGRVKELLEKVHKSL